MKRFGVLLLLVLQVSVLTAEEQIIVCGTHPGEIYFDGIHPDIPYQRTGFYFSSNAGEHIEIRGSAGWYGLLVADAQDSTVYQILDRDYITTDGGWSWNIVNDTSAYKYASGVMPGEIYRRSSNGLERSINFGIDYEPCTSAGFPDTLSIHSTALGINSGEVYIWGAYGNLYYSDDYGENFTFLGDLYSTWGVNPWTSIVNGAVSGEIYIYLNDMLHIWRVWDYGDSVESFADFFVGHELWSGGIATSRQPGEVYFLAENVDMSLDCRMHIYHTVNYGASWDFYEHIVDPTSVSPKSNVQMPSNISLTIFPNPANAAFNIDYELNTMQDVRLIMYDVLGRQVWRNDIGTQSPGNYQLSFADNGLPGGKYFFQLKTKTITVIKSLTVLK